MRWLSPVVWHVELREVASGQVLATRDLELSEPCPGTMDPPDSPEAVDGPQPAPEQLDPLQAELEAAG